MSYEKGQAEMVACYTILLLFLLYKPFKLYYIIILKTWMIIEAFWSI